VAPANGEGFLRHSLMFLQSWFGGSLQVSQKLPPQYWHENGIVVSAPQ
jgi:hypothetical protein